MIVRHFHKNIPLFGENTPVFHILTKFRYLSAISRHFPHIKFKNKTQFFSYFNSFIMLACPNIIGTKFRYFSATFAKIDSGTAFKIPPLLAFIFR
jgi:hypothetical protein